MGRREEKRGDVSPLQRFGAGVNRADFIPERIWIRPEGEQLRPLDRADDPELWAEHVAAEESVVTQVSKDANGMLWPTSSSSALHTMRQMVDAAALEPDLNVLEIGTGTGYNAALMADLGVRVTTMEIDPELAAAASAALERTGFADRVTVITRDGERGASEQAPFDRVIVTAAARTIPYTWVEQTRDGGRLVVPYSGPECAGALLVLDVAGGTATGRAVGDAFFMPLRGQKQPQSVLRAERAPDARRRLRITVTQTGQNVALVPTT
ncbi:protein-L-isoaspartate O-methyltransferase family protein [Actinomadura madurae]|uniref:protein-L-isoaspartate O-methyltransferase family protein n=1 Tax=Actinomadura madurae TaxID=1993 RepID=UPI00042013EF|nr:methyltransferase domain-containing protein [Actinomadura madurae]